MPKPECWMRDGLIVEIGDDDESINTSGYEERRRKATQDRGHAPIMQKD